MPLFNNKRKDFSIQPPKQSIANGAFSVLDSANINFTYANNELSADLTQTGVVPNTYGNATNVPQFTVDIWGRITGVTLVPILGGGSWSLTGNAGTDGGITNFLGTTDNTPLQFRVNNVQAGYISDSSLTALGVESLSNFVTNSIAIGHRSLKNSIGDNLIGIGNLAFFGSNMNDSIGIGVGCLNASTGSNVIAIGDNIVNLGFDDVIAIGASAPTASNQFIVTPSITHIVMPLNGQTNGYVLTTDGTKADWQPSTGGGTYTVDNGLTENPASNFQLGGTLVQNTLIDTDTYYLSIFGTLVSSNGLFRVDGTGSANSHVAAYFNMNSAGSAVYGRSDGVGVVGEGNLQGVAGTSTTGVAGGFQTISGQGINVSAESGLPIRISSNPASTNTISSIVQSYRFSSGTAANGIGGSFDFYNQDTLGFQNISNKIISKLSTATSGSVVSQFEIEGVNSGVLSRLFALTGPGQLILDKYITSTAFASVSGASVGVLNVDNAGNVFVAAGGGGASPLTTKGDLYTFDTADARLPVGLDTQVLLADSTAATGLKWGTNTTPPASGYYGAFSDVTDQTAAVINTGYPMLLGVTDLTNGVTVVSGSRVTIANTGIYNIQWSGQFRNPTAAEHDVTIWLRKNGVDVPGSAGVVLVPKKHGLFDGHTLPSWNFLLDPVAGDYYEFVWSTEDINVFLSFQPAGSPPPSTASVVLTVTQQAGIMAGTGITGLGKAGFIQTGATQTLVEGTSGSDFNIVSSSNTQTFNLPTASAINRGALSSADWTTFNGKAPLASPAFTGSPTAPTQSALDNSTKIATTAFVIQAVERPLNASNLFNYYNFI